MLIPSKNSSKLRSISIDLDHLPSSSAAKLRLEAAGDTHHQAQAQGQTAEEVEAGGPRAPLHPPDNGLLVKSHVTVAHQVLAARAELLDCGLRFEGLRRCLRSCMQASMWNNLHPDQVIGTPAIIKEIDCLTAKIDDIHSVTAECFLSINMDKTRVSGIAGWFDVHFRGSVQNLGSQEIQLTLTPSIYNPTYWAQQDPISGSHKNLMMGIRASVE